MQRAIFKQSHKLEQWHACLINMALSWMQLQPDNEIILVAHCLWLGSHMLPLAAAL